MQSDVFFSSARTLTYKDSLSKIKGPLVLKNLGIEEKIKKKIKL